MSKPKSLDIAKFLKIAGMLNSPAEQERATAAKITTELLSASGFTWEQILQAGANRLAIPQKNHPAQPAPSAVPQEVNDFFSNLFKATAKTQPGRTAEANQPEARKHKEYFGGSRIPPQFEGEFEILDERATRQGTAMLVITVLSEKAHYGPVIVFDSDIIKTIKSPSSVRTRFICWIRHSQRAQYPDPVLYKISPAQA
jgi:hypothetical protein